MSTFTPIASQTVIGSSTATVTFAGIPQHYRDLQLVMVCANDTSDANTTGYLRFNGDDNNNYADEVIYTNGNTPTSFSSGLSSAIGLWTIMGNTDTNRKSIITMNLLNYSTVGNYKNALTRVATPPGTSGWVATYASMWKQTQAIQNITIGGGANWLVGSTFNLYGISTGDGYADGGNSITTDGTYWYHTFTSSGAFIPRKALTVDYLVVAGGGAGGREDYGSGLGGGGGAGGVRCTVGATGGGGSLESALALTANTLYPVLVGAGGIFSTAGGRGSNGGNSTFGSIVAIGGGGGAGGEGGGWTYKGQNGGSGGGGEGSTTSNVFGGGNSSTGGTGTANQGFAGGNSIGGTGGGSGGGGGAGEAGNTNGGAQGGDGVATSISGSSVTYGGGGGGALYGTTSAGGAGGGGTGADYHVTGATNGTANTGGGGGGGSNSAAHNKSGAGGSGIVIVRYAV